MKKTFKPALFVLLMCGVFGVDEVKAVSVMEGDSVTLNPDRTQIQGFNEIEWRFKDSDQPIAYSDGRKPTYPVDERFRDRLKLDHQTGSLTITNMKTKHSGLYKLQIELNSGSLTVNFDVNVYESPSVIDAVKGEINFESVKEGDPVTLQTDVTQLSGDELIVWRCGEEGKLIAKADKEAKSSPFYDTDEGFRGRLELENKTGSLIITNTRTTDSGYYTVKISSNKQTVYKRFTVTVTVTVTVSGLSSGDKAGIGVLFAVAAAAVAAVAAGFIYHRCKMSELRKQTSTVTVTEGEPVTLKPKEIKKVDKIQVMFGEGEQWIPIAEIRGETGEIVTHDYAAGGIFSGRLKLDRATGSLTIKNSTTTHSGLYKLHITTSGVSSEQTFMVTVNENVEVKSVEDGSVTLYPDPLNPDTEIQGDDLILWMFGDQDCLIAEIRGGNVKIYDAANKRFKLKLSETTGSLTITDIKAEHTGLYKLQTINSSRGETLFKKYRVYMQFGYEVTVGNSVRLSTGLTKIERDDEVQWRFGDDSLIAEIKGGTGEPCYFPDGKFRNRLQLDKSTGDLTILNFTAEHEGCYNLKIHDRKGNTNKIHSITIRGVAVTDKVRKKLTKKENNVNKSAVVEMQPLMNK